MPVTGNRRVMPVVPVLLLAAAVLAACGGGDAPAPAAPGGAAAAAPAPSVTPTGDTTVVEMITDGAGNVFGPADLTVRRGDVVRFVLTSGVHNVHFVADSNAGVTSLPAPSDMLQLPGQTHDILVDLPAGRTYYYHCDPHALIGMVGHLTVTE